MFNTVFKNFTTGLKRVFKSPQLLYTILVGVAIFVAFLFVSQRFLSIAQQAQERLISVRTASLHDGFAAFSSENLNNSDLLKEKINVVAESNKTITEFDVVTVDDQGNYKIIASLTDREVIPEEFTFLFNATTFDPEQTFQGEYREDGERIFRSVRAIIGDNGEVEGYLLTTAGLSEADRLINRNILVSIAILVGVIGLIMFLFFMHSRIIDYAYLYKELQDIDNLKDDFISMASHELRTPLTVIRGYAAELEENNWVTQDEGKEYLHRIAISSERLANLVNDMLDVARIEQGRLVFDFKIFNPNSVIVEAVDSFKPIAKDKGLAISYTPGAISLIAADEKRLTQVIINIVGNAVKYTKEGSVQITTDVIDDGETFQIRVIDTGIGMSAEEQNNLFQKFYRVKNKDTDAVQGTGLGLWITKQMVEKMHGDISVESIRGVGTHIIINFPIVNR